MVRTTLPHLRYSNVWDPTPETEINRLQKKLYLYLKKMKISISKQERVQFVVDLLEKQKKTCAFGKNVGGKYCWNKPKYSNKKYLYLEFTHIFSSALSPETNDNDPVRLKYFYLLCTRCNKQIQTSRNLFQLQVELENKLRHIDELLKKL